MKEAFACVPPGRYDIFVGSAGGFRVTVWRPIEESTGTKESLPASVPQGSLADQGQRFGERGGGLARRRYQKGRVFLRGKKNPVWVGRWREDEIRDGRVYRVERSEVLGSRSDFPTKRLALRELEKRLTVVNDPRYRARPTSRFAEFASRWESLVLIQHKLSTQVTIRSHFRKHLIPFFGRMQMRDSGQRRCNGSSQLSRSVRKRRRISWLLCRCSGSRRALGAMSPMTRRLTSSCQSVTR